MLILKNIKITFLGLLVAFMLPSISSATHIVGGDLTYKCLGNDKYEITLTVQRDCINGASDAELDDPATIGIYDRFGALQVGLGISGKLFAPISSYRILNTSLDDCSLGAAEGICVEEAIYKDIVCLPYNKLGYYVAYQRCCRNGILSNIQNPLETGATYFAFLSTTALEECNSQPVFNDWPAINICSGQTLDFNHSATDPDGDVLVYRLCAPSSGASIDNPYPVAPSSPPYDPILWNNGFGTDDVFGSSDELTINSDGVLMGTPEILGTYLVGVCVDEYRNGELLSTVMRDFEYNVVACTSPVTVDVEIRGGGCDGDNTVSFINNTTGADTYRWFFDFPSADPATMSSATSPTFTYPGPGTYTVRLEAIRASDGCIVTRDLTVTVGSQALIKADFRAIPIACDGDNVTIRFQDITVGAEGYSADWIINGQSASGENVEFTFNQNDLVEVSFSKVDDEGCESKLTRTINLSDLLANPPDFDVELVDCTATHFDIIVTNPAGGDTEWSIESGSTVVPESATGTVAQFRIFYNSNGDANFSITMDTDNTCYEDAATKTFSFSDLARQEFDIRLISCDANTSTFVLTNVTGDTANWSVESSSGAQSFSGNLVTVTIPNGPFSVRMVPENQCYDPINSDFNTDDYRDASFEAEFVACTEEGYIFNFINNSGTVVDWTIVDGNSSVSESGHTVTATIDTDSFSVTMDPDNGCSDPITMEFEVFDYVNPSDIRADFRAIPTICDGNRITVLFEDITVGADGFERNWVINGNTFTGESLTVELPANGIVEVSLSVSSDDLCNRSNLTRSIDLSDLVTDYNFDVVLVSCESGVHTYMASNPAGGTTLWSIIDSNNNTQQLSGPDITFEIPLGDFTVIMDTDNNCFSGPIEATFSTDEFLNPEIDVRLLGCTSSGNFFSFTNPTTANASWTIFTDNGTFNLSGNNVSLLIPSGEFTVSMSLDNDCYDLITDTYNSEDFLAPDFDVIVVNCTATGTIYNFENSSGTVAIWTITDGNSTVTATGHTVTATIDTDSYTVTMDLNNGCSDPLTVTLDNDTFGSISPEVAIEECTDNGAVIILSNGSSSSTTWTVTDANNMTTTVIGNPVSVNVSTESFTIDMIVDNACIDDFSGNYTLSDLLPQVQITNNSPLCLDPAGQEVTFTPSITNNSLGTPAYSWSYTVNSGPVATSNAGSISILLNSGDVVDITLETSFQNGCVVSTREVFTANSSVGTLDIIEDINCDDPDQTVVTLTDVTNITGTEVSSYNWNVNGTISSGPSVEFIVRDQVVNVSLQVLYENGCTSTYSNTFSPEDFTPTLDYDVDLLSCMDSTGIFLFTFDGFVPECMDIESIVWTIDGVTYTGPTVEVELPLNEEIQVGLVVTYTNGLVLDISQSPLTTIDTGDFLIDLPVIIDNNSSDPCNDSLNLFIVDPVTGVIYNWYTDPGFTELVATGTTYMSGLPENFTGTIYVETEITDDCFYGTGQFTLDIQPIELEFNNPYIICPGDTAAIMVTNVNPDQEIEYLWKGGAELISGETTATPVVGIPDNQTEDFFLVLCTSNQFGCTRVDTINFTIGLAMDVPAFTFEPDSCGSFTIHFESDADFPDGVLWDFGDDIGTSNEQNPTYTYSEEGVYTVTLSNNSVFCMGEPYSEDIMVPFGSTIDIALDTLTYEATPVTVTAETSGDPDSIRWCLIDGTEASDIFVGHPLEYSPEQDTVTVVAKITDEFGCSDSDTIVLIRVSNLPSDPSISGDDIVCPEEEFTLSLDFDGDPEDYTYFWEPEECVISGGDTPTALVKATSSKTFSVLITDMASGEDTTVTFDVLVAVPEISIVADNGIPDQEGLPQVCQGSDIELSADPDDPDCTYTWSTGETGSSITVSPNENASYSVTCVNSEGCENSASTDIEVIPPTCSSEDIFIPSAFSPNGDNVNDRLFVRSKFIREIEFFVVDRWGSEVFRTNDQSQGWDGTFNGEQLAPDVYAYCVIATCVNDQEYRHSGNVSILK